MMEIVRNVNIEFYLLLLGCVYSFPTVTSSLEYNDMVLLAQAEAKCLKLGYKRVNKHPETDVYARFKCNSTACDKCIRATRKTFTTLSDCRASCENSEECIDMCQQLARNFHYYKNDTVSFPVLSNQNWSISPPELYCEIIPPNNSKTNHQILLKWNVQQNGSKYEEPIVFVVTMRIEDKLNYWKVLGKTAFGLQSFRVQPSKMYQWHLTIVTSEGIVDSVAYSEWISSLSGYESPDPPSDIFISNTSPTMNGVETTIGWIPPKQRSCFYKIYWYHQMAQDVKSERIKEPRGSFLYQLGVLEFDTEYIVSITSRDEDWIYESPKKTINFTTESCLHLFHYSYLECAPLPPTNIHVNIIPYETSSMELYRAIISWNPPNHTSQGNAITSYQVNITSSIDALLLHSERTAINKHFIVDGNVREVILDNLTPDSGFIVLVSAASRRGYGKPMNFGFRTPQSDSMMYASTFLTKETTSIVVIVTSLSVALSVVSCYLSHKWKKNRDIKKARSKYFEEMERNDIDKENSSSIVSLDDRKELLESDPFEIDFESLVMGNIIGEGAFGIVRLAGMLREYRVTDESNTGYMAPNKWQIVAVKMLKEKGMKEDRFYLLEEIEMMKNIGTHSLLVSMLAACTRGRNICLVLEYCPGGDLLSYLRKVREEFYSNSDLESDGIDSSVQNDSGAGSSCANLCYADLDIPKSVSQSMLTIAPPGVVDENQDVFSNCDIYDVETYRNRIVCLKEKDVLSYARQIATGMEYLERNRLVHRDLAARNILLTKDYTMIKISDFGLSKDIYTWDVYRQKSSGKVPVKWMAVESLFDQIFTTKSDVWSFGIVLWEVVTLGGAPYPGISNSDLLQLLKTGYRMEAPDNCSEELYSLMQKCWRTSANSRPSFSELQRQLGDMLDSSKTYLSLNLNLTAQYYNMAGRESEHKNQIFGMRMEDKSKQGVNITMTNYTNDSASSQDEGPVISSDEGVSCTSRGISEEIETFEAVTDDDVCENSSVFLDD